MDDLSLKYRPKTFEEVYQPPIVTSMINAVEHDRLSHAYLYDGPKGTGKTTMGRLVSMLLSCEDPRGHNPCGSCRPCRFIWTGKMQEVAEINAAEATGKGDMEEMISGTINHMPVSVPKRIYILDECHMLSNNAQNSLLKVLEEPPEYVVFFLCTTESRKLVPTVVDRCLHYRFQPIPPKAIEDRLIHVCGLEGIKFEERALSLIASESQGSMRLALKTVQKMATDAITEDQVRSLLGRTSAEAALEVLDMILEGNRFKCINWINSFITTNDLGGLFREVLDCLADLLILISRKRDASWMGHRSEAERERMVAFSKKLVKGKEGRQVRELARVFEQGARTASAGISPAKLTGALVLVDAISAMEEVGDSN